MQMRVEVLSLYQCYFRGVKFFVSIFSAFPTFQTKLWAVGFFSCSCVVSRKVCCSAAM